MVTKPRIDEYVLDQSWSPARLPTRRHVSIEFATPLFEQILAEAKSRGWSFARMVRHLCEASIDGIE